jgi:DNA-binding CsgD family transcriptional regulator
MVLEGSPMDGIISDDSGASRTLENGSTMPNEGPFPYGINRKECGLIPLERQVIALAVAGYSSVESAKKIGISEPALKRQLTGICDKLRVSNQFELILFALHHKLIETYETSPSAD